MFSSFKNHPFAVEAFFEYSYVLTFAVPLAEIQPLVPACFTVDHFNNEWGFIALATVATKSLRPKGFPAFLGNDFILTGYRVFVRYTNKDGKNKKGLYILRSETNKRSMVSLGNFFTHYNYTLTDISVSKSDKEICISSEKSGIDISLSPGGEMVALPAESPFNNWKEARRYAGPLPFTFNYNAVNKTVLSVEGVRQYWQPRPLQVNACRVGYLNQLSFNRIQLASAFVVEQVPYYWKKGKQE